MDRIVHFLDVVLESFLISLQSLHFIARQLQMRSLFILVLLHELIQKAFPSFPLFDPTHVLRHHRIQEFHHVFLEQLVHFPFLHVTTFPRFYRHRNAQILPLLQNVTQRVETVFHLSLSLTPFPRFHVFHHALAHLLHQRHHFRG